MPECPSCDRIRHTNAALAQPSRFPIGGGDVGKQMRAQDWSGSPLGPPASWPASLRTVVDLLLQSRFPMFVAWGPELGFIYNDCLLYTSDAADERSSVDLGGRRIIKKK